MDINTTLDDKFSELQSVLKLTDDKRNALIDVLMASVPNLNIDPVNDGASKLEAKLSLIKTIDDILKSKENATSTIVKLSMSRKDSDNLENISESVAEMLKRVELNKVPTGVATTNVLDESIDKDIEKICEEQALPITDAELEMDE